MKHINLETLANGAFTEQVNREIQKVIENIQDPNTDAKAARKVTVTITLKPNEQRDFISTGVVAKSTLAPALGGVPTFRLIEAEGGVWKNQAIGNIKEYLESNLVVSPEINIVILG